MAFLAQDPNQDPNNPQNQNGQQPAGAPGTLGGSNTAPTLSGTGGGGSLGGGAPGAAAAASPKGTSSGSFVNLQNYVDANKGNDAQLGQAVENTVAGKAQAADTAGQGFQQAGQDAVDKGTVKEDTGLVDNLNAAGAGTGKLNNYDQNYFNNQFNAAYKGPAQAADVSGYGDTSQAYKNTQDEAQAASSSDITQRGAALKDTFGTGGRQYNQGENTLDSFLLGAGSGGQSAQQDIASKYGNYTDNFGKLTDYLGNVIKTGQDTTAKTKTDVDTAAHNALFGQSPDVAAIRANAIAAGRNPLADTSDVQPTHGIQGRLDTATTQSGSANDGAAGANKAFSSGDVAALKKVGYSDDAIAYLKSHNANFGAYATNGSKYGTSDFANANDVLNFQNLTKLIGGAGGDLTGAHTYDFNTKGGSAGGANQADVKAANDLATLEKTLGQGVQSANDARTADYKNALAALTFGANGGAGSTAELAKLGITPDQLTWAKTHGVDPLAFLKQGGAETAGQVASADQKTQLTKLAQLLGISPDEAAIAPGAAAGDPFSFDTAGWQKAYGAVTPPPTNNLTPVAAGQLAINTNHPTVEISGQPAATPDASTQALITGLQNGTVTLPTAQIDPLEKATLEQMGGQQGLSPMQLAKWVASAGMTAGSTPSNNL